MEAAPDGGEAWMRVLVTSEQRFDRLVGDGSVWTPAAFTYPFWRRYLEVFSQVEVLARVREVASVPPTHRRADGDGVSFRGLPYYVGPWAYARRAREVRRQVRRALGSAEAVILRLPSTSIAQCVEQAMRESRRPYGVEVVGDPYDVFAPGGMRHPLRPVLRWWLPRCLHRQCGGACAAAYVTQRALQTRYPPPPGSFTTHYSSVELPGAALAGAPRSARAANGPLRLITVGSLDHPAKGVDTLIDAVAACTRQGLQLSLTIVGDGRLRARLQRRAAAAGVAERVAFLGYVPTGEGVRAHLDASDLFVLPSKAEGLPRAVIEAMARALPCIATAVGGIPELLPASDLVPPGCVAALSAKIAEVAGEPERAARMSRANLERARGYVEEVLRERRKALYERLREVTAAWLRVQARRQGKRDEAPRSSRAEGRSAPAAARGGE